MAAITSNPSCFELSDDGTNEPESDVSCTTSTYIFFNEENVGMNW